MHHVYNSALAQDGGERLGAYHDLVATWIII